MELTFEIPGKCEIRARKPTLSEFLVISDKLTAAYGDGKRPNDFMDDGDDEIAKLITSPSKREFYELMEDFPTLPIKIWSALKENCGENVEVSLEENLTEQELSAFGKRCIAVTVKGLESEDSKRFVMRKIPRSGIKILLRDNGDKGTLTANAISQVTKECIISENKMEALALFEKFPLVAMKFGMHLVSASNANVELLLKKA